MNEAESSSPPFAARHTHTDKRNTWLTGNCNIRAALLGWSPPAATPIKRNDMQKVQVRREWSKGRTADLRDGRQALNPLVSANCKHS
jgi:hypothetical protein